MANVRGSRPHVRSVGERAPEGPAIDCCGSRLATVVNGTRPHLTNGPGGLTKRGRARGGERRARLELSIRTVTTTKSDPSSVSAHARRFHIPEGVLRCLTPRRAWLCVG